MAIFHLTVDVVSRGNNTPTKTFSATKAASYRSGEKIKDERTGEIHNYTKREDVLHSNILAPEGAKDWVYDRSQLANKIEFSEKRKNSQLVRTLEGSLPEELTLEQQKEMLEKFLTKNFVSKGMVADYSIHRKPDGKDGHPNPHVHIALTMRKLDGDGFYKTKERSWNDFNDDKGNRLKNIDKTLHKGWREDWADLQNEYLGKYGHSDRVSHLSYEEQGIEKIPQKHEGKELTAQKRKGLKVNEKGERYDRVQENKRINHKNKVNDYIYDSTKQYIDEIKQPAKPTFQKQVVEKHDSKSQRHAKMLSNYVQSAVKPSIQAIARIKEFVQNIKTKTADFTKSIQEKIKTGFAERVKNERKNAPVHSNADELDVAGNSIITRGR